MVGDFVLGALVDDRIGQVLDAQTGLTGRRHRRDRVLLRWVDHILDRRAGVEVVEVHDFSITVGVAAPTGRGHTADAVRDIEVDGHLVEAGNILVVGIYALHRDPELWNHPLVFDSDRFSPQNSDGRDRWQYLPFGAGHARASATTSPCSKQPSRSQLSFSVPKFAPQRPISR